MEAAVRVPGGAGMGHGGTQPAVSIVVPCFNGGPFLDGLLASLERQTFRDFETIIVNDGSTDAATLSKLAEIESRVRVIHQNNRGLSAARNAGISAARTDFVAVLDCDDTFEPPFLGEAVALMRSAPPEVAVVFSHLRLTGVANGLIERHFNSFDLLFTNTLPSGLLLRKASWQAVGGYDESMREGYEDWEFYLRLAHAGFRGVEIAKPYFNYAVASGGMLFNRSSHIHAALWRAIRRKHATLYRPVSLLNLWWATRGGSRHISLGKALVARVLAAVLPDTWYSRMIAERRRRMLLEGHLPAYTGQVSAAITAAKQA